MRLEQAASLARSLMARHGLEGWSFSFDGARRRLGACWPGRRHISLSRHFVQLNERALVEDVILHEIAHALTPGDGHGRRFKLKALELGCSAKACHPSEAIAMAPAPIVLECRHCGRTWHRYRAPTRKLVCKSCLGSLGGQARPLRVRRVDLSLS